MLRNEVVPRPCASVTNDHCAHRPRRRRRRRGQHYPHAPIMPPRTLQSYVSDFTSNWLALYSSISVVFVCTVIANALRAHSNFYSVTVYLAKSNGAVIVRGSLQLKHILYSNPSYQDVGQLLHSLCCPNWSRVETNILWRAPDD